MDSLEFFRKQRVDELGDLSVSFELSAFVVVAFSALDWILSVTWAGAASSWLWEILFSMFWIAMPVVCAWLASRRLRHVFLVYAAMTCTMAFVQFVYTIVISTYIKRHHMRLPGLLGFLVFWWFLRFIPIGVTVYYAIRAAALRGGGARRMVIDEEDDAPAYGNLTADAAQPAPYVPPTDLSASAPIGSIAPGEALADSQLVEQTSHVDPPSQV
eukprot:m51a1_g11326 hypothetical protein (214) ;mRNA; r:127460-128438